jgi:hypothetical protein
MSERTREQFDQELSAEAASFAGLRPSQAPGLAQLFELVRVDERAKVADELERLADLNTVGGFDLMHSDVRRMIERLRNG